MPGELIPIFGILLTMIPVAGVTLTFTIRHAVRPLVETLADALRESGDHKQDQQLTNEVLRLQEEIESLAHEIREMKGAQEFDKKLLGPEGAGAGPVLVPETPQD
jgi:hypothetical protein